MARHHKLLYFFTVSAAIFIFRETKAAEIINFSQSPSLTQGSSSESIFCEADQKIDSCGWKKNGNEDFKVPIIYFFDARSPLRQKQSLYI